LSTLAVLHQAGMNIAASRRRHREHGGSPSGTAVLLGRSQSSAVRD